MQLKLKFPEEIWKEIPGYPLNMASNLGRIKSKDHPVPHKGSPNNERIIKGRILGNRIEQSGYIRIDVCLGKKNNKVFAHRLVAIAFLDNPENKKEVNHINGVKSDNRVENLEWVTPSENMQHAHSTGLKSGIVGEDNILAKTSKPVVLKMRELYKNGFSAIEISRSFNFSYQGTWKIVKNKTWKHLI